MKFRQLILTMLIPAALALPSCKSRSEGDSHVKDVIGPQSPIFLISASIPIDSNFRKIVDASLGNAGKQFCVARGSFNGADGYGIWLNFQSVPCEKTGTVSGDKVLSIAPCALQTNCEDEIVVPVVGYVSGPRLTYQPSTLYYLCSQAAATACTLDLNGVKPVITMTTPPN